ncbi:MAG TPA: MlaD family protein [Solirubrobacteraceae bacterium]|jgi:phospholipid/cholesterol/gamma-HCH transport system substrate-binding protein
MTLARAIALGALVLAGVLVAVLLLGGTSTTKYTIKFENAGQLVKDDDVQIGGRRIGSVKDIRLTNDNQAEVDIEVEEGFVPLREGTRALIKATSLSGIANRYIVLEPGNGRELDDGATLQQDKTTSIVEIDQLFNTLDDKTRKALQEVIQGSATQFRDKGDRANLATKYFNPTLSTTRELVNEVGRDERTLQRFLIDGAKATSALAEKRSTLTDLISNSNLASQGIADESDALNEILLRLPSTMRRANSTFVNLRATLTDLDVLVAESKPATRRLAPFFRELRPLVRDARPTIHDLRVAIRRPGKDNDLVELMRLAPTVARTARPALQNTTTAIRKSLPVLDFSRPYLPELTGWFRDFGQAGANYDANGHFGRIQPLFNTFQYRDDAAGGTLVPQDPNNRLSGVETGNFKRCPGAASQPAADGSAPYTDNGLDCDPRLALNGP